MLQRLKMLLAPEGEGGAGGTGAGGGAAADGGSAAPIEKKDGGGATPPAGSEKKAAEGEGAKRSMLKVEEKKGGTDKTGGQEGEAKAKDAVSEPFEVKAPEGMKVDAAELKAYSTFAKESGLSQEQASKALSYYAQLEAKQQQAVVKQADVWYGELEKDSEIGGAKFAESQADLQKALVRFDADGQVRKLLEESYLDNHPALVKMLVRVGRGLKEDGQPAEKTPGQGKRLTTQERRQKFYDDMPKDKAQ